MAWQCAAIDHGVTVFPDGRIGPCCQIGLEYLKPIELIRDPNRFQDLKTDKPPSACRICVNNERVGISSYRELFNQRVQNAPGIQFFDVRNTNLCNLKCRYCGPHFSNQWAMELKVENANMTTPVSDILDYVISDSLQWIYFTGGEPMINPDHWTILKTLVDSNRSSRIDLLYNTNLTTIKYKDVDIADLWGKFRTVTINVSVDAIGEPLSYVRSGSDWDRVRSNLDRVKELNHVRLKLTPVVSILNIWFLDELYDYAAEQHLELDSIILHGPDYLALDVIPDQLKSRALEIIDSIEQHALEPVSKYQHMRDLINRNINNCLFQHTLNHILLLDHRRKERLFDLLPFGSVAQQMILGNHEYK